MPALGTGIRNGRHAIWPRLRGGPSGALVPGRPTRAPMTRHQPRTQYPRGKESIWKRRPFGKALERIVVVQHGCIIVEIDDKRVIHVCDLQTETMR